MKGLVCKVKIILTGATGFLGSKLLRRLLEEEQQVVVLKRSTSDLGRIRQWKNRCICYDVDKIKLSSVFEKEKPDVVIHCATTYGRGGNEAVRVMQTNVMFGLELLTCACECGCKYFINTGSYFVKQIAEWGRVKKDVYMADYTLSKYQFLCWGEEFATLSKINFINMNLEHIFGEEDDKGKFIYMIEKNCLENVETLELSDGMQLRDYIYSENVADAYICVLQHLEELKGYHNFEVGMGEPILLKDFVRMIKEAANSSTKLEFGKRPRNTNEPECSKADITNLRKLGWEPRFSRKEGIERMLRLNNSQ